MTNEAPEPVRKTRHTIEPMTDVQVQAAVVMARRLADQSYIARALVQLYEAKITKPE